jgi:hypothetical protein
MLAQPNFAKTPSSALNIAELADRYAACCTASAAATGSPRRNATTRHNRPGWRCVKTPSTSAIRRRRWMVGHHHAPVLRRSTPEPVPGAAHLRLHGRFPRVDARPTLLTQSPPGTQHPALSGHRPTTRPGTTHHPAATRPGAAGIRTDQPHHTDADRQRQAGPRSRPPPPPNPPPRPRIASNLTGNCAAMGGNARVRVDGGDFRAG